MIDIKLRIAELSDVLTLVEFNQLMALETEQKRLDENTLRKGVAALIEDKSKGFYLVVECESKIVASLMVTTEWSDWRNSEFWWIQSVYVSKSFRRKGLYSALYSHLKVYSKDYDVCGFRLYVERDNAIAKSTYTSLGMTESHYLMYEESLPKFENGYQLD